MHPFTIADYVLLRRQELLQEADAYRLAARAHEAARNGRPRRPTSETESTLAR